MEMGDNDLVWGTRPSWLIVRFGPVVGCGQMRQYRRERGLYEHWTDSVKLPAR